MESNHILNNLKNDSKIIISLFKLVMRKKKYWLLPVLFIFSLLSLMLVLVGSSGVLPVIYALF